LNFLNAPHTHVLVAHVAYNFNCIVEIERFLKIQAVMYTVYRRSGTVPEMAPDTGSTS